MILNIWVKCMNKNKKKLKRIAIILLYIIITAVSVNFNIGKENQTGNIIEKISYAISNIPKYSGEIFIEINNNVPQFTAQDISIQKDYYSDLENGRVRKGNDKN